MFLSQEIDIKLCQRYTKYYILEIWYRNQSYKQIIFSKYATNLKNDNNSEVPKQLRYTSIIIRIHYLFIFYRYNWKYDWNVCITWLTFPPMAVKYQCHAIHTETRGHIDPTDYEMKTKLLFWNKVFTYVFCCKLYPCQNQSELDHRNI